MSLLVYPAIAAVVWFTRGDLVTIIAGGSLFPLARLLAFAPVIVSFNLRSLRSLHDSLLLGLATILIVSERALSIEFGVILLAFGVAVLGFLAAAYPVDELQHMRLVASARTLGIIGPVVGIVVLTLGVAVAAFLIIPQTYRVQDAGPLPSRLDLTIGRPPPLPDDLGPGTAPSPGILPSRDTASPDAEVGAAAGPPSSGEADGTAAGQETAGDGSQPSQTGTNAPPDGQPAGQEAAGNGSQPSRTGSNAPPDGQPAETPADAANGDTGRFVGASAQESYVTLGYQGDDEGDVVMHVRSPLASYWRGQVVNVYDGRGWKASDRASALTVDRAGLLHFTDAKGFEASRGRYVQSFYPRVSQLDRVFTGYTPGYVALQDPAERGGVREMVEENLRRLHEAGSYRVVSAIPGLTPEALRLDSVVPAYLPLLNPPDVPPRVKELAESIVAGTMSDYDQALLLERFLLANYTYDLRVSSLSRSSDVVDRFLFEGKAGYCAQFATTMAVMARLVGLPARVATGYLPGEYNSLTGAHTVRLSDAHAWVEINFRRYGWVPFDPTSRPDSPWALDSGFTKATRGLQETMRSQLKDFIFDGSSSALDGAATLATAYGPAWMASVLVAALVVLVGALLVRRLRAPFRRERSAGYMLLRDGERLAVRKVYQSALGVLGRKGYPERQPHEGPVDYVRSLQARGLEVPTAFGAISRHAAHALYDPAPLDRGAVEDARIGLKSLQKMPKLAM